MLLSWYKLQGKKFILLVTKDITFELLFLLLLVSIVETKSIKMNQSIFYMNAKTKVEQILPNNIECWFKRIPSKKRRYLMRHVLKLYSLNQSIFIFNEVWMSLCCSENNNC